MAFTTEQLTEINSIITQGASTVKYADKEVTYRTLNELKEIKEMIKTEAEPTPPGNFRKGRSFAQFSKGL